MPVASFFDSVIYSCLQKGSTARLFKLVLIIADLSLILMRVIRNNTLPLLGINARAAYSYNHHHLIDIDHILVSLYQTDLLVCCD